ncbi:MAG: aromatic ring-hydroxylating dioxygenase subunit alpha [Actinobacteria bacterium]|nr:MAG: aromatic ring-hydroxylating dioxygenase subunit alpha [Actinomycetota bacterium]
MTRDVPPGELYFQSLLDAETRPVPESLRTTSTTAEEPVIEIARERYFDRDFHRLEVERVWRRVWQMACREEEITQVGDTLVYDIVDASLLIVRTAPVEIRAFHNSCLHRGTQLRAGPGHVAELRCPFHGFTWNLDGSFREMPCSWDFPHVDPACMHLPEAQVGTWGGFVFVNLDPDAAPLADYLEDLPWHFAAWPLEDRYKSAHGVKVMPCNWKVALEAFIEAYHTVAVHPQLLRTSGDTVTEYDVYRRHVSRMITPVGVASEHLGREVDDAEMLKAMFLTRDDDLAVEEGSTARRVLADRVRTQLQERTGRDFSNITDAEALDGIEYFLFPNFMPWAGFTTPLVYRFRPNGDDPDSCVMEVMLLDPIPADGPRPPPVPTRYLGEDESWADVPELGYLGRILNQDSATFGRVQRGLHASVKPNITVGRYQESRIRHFHVTLDAYLDTKS